MAEPSSGEQIVKNIPALSLGTLTNFTDKFKSEHQIPTQIDKSMFPSTMSGVNQNAVLSALRFFGFTSEENKPQPVFYEYVGESKEGRERLWRERVQAAYGFLLDHVDIERTTSAAVAERFQAQGIKGDTIRKAVTFFLHAAKAGNMKVSEHVKAPRPPQIRGKKNNGTSEDAPPENSGATKISKNGKGKKAPAHNNTPPPKRTDQEAAYDILISILNKKMTKEQKDAVWIIIQYLKENEEG